MNQNIWHKGINNNLIYKYESKILIEKVDFKYTFFLNIEKDKIIIHLAANEILTAFLLKIVLQLKTQTISQIILFILTLLYKHCIGVNWLKNWLYVM